MIYDKLMSFRFDKESSQNYKNMITLLKAFAEKGYYESFTICFTFALHIYI